MSSRSKARNRASDSLESGEVAEHEPEHREKDSGSSRNALWITLAMLFFIGGAAYVERNVLAELVSPSSLDELQQPNDLAEGSGVPPPPRPKIASASPAEEAARAFAEADAARRAAAASATASAKAAPAPRAISAAAIVPAAAASALAAAAAPAAVARAAARGGKPAAERREELEKEVARRTAEVRKMKFTEKRVMERDPEAMAATKVRRCPPS